MPGVEGGVTCDFTDGRTKPVYDAAMAYRAAAFPLLVIAGKDYGSGSSRDWAAKGHALLGVKAVLAESFERIHRSNLSTTLRLDTPREQDYVRHGGIVKYALRAMLTSMT